MKVADRWQSFTAKTDNNTFKDAHLLWTGTGGDNTRLPVPAKPVADASYVYLLKIENHNYIRFTIIDGLELNSIKTKSFNPYQTNGYTARLEY